MSIPEEMEQLRLRLEEAEATLAAIREGQVDALVVAAPDGDRVFTLRTADHPYRVLVETMSEGAITVLGDGLILYANRRFVDMVGKPPEAVTGASIFDFVAPDHRHAVRDLLEIGLGGRGSGEATLIGPRGGSFPVMLSLNRVDIDDTRAICIIATDLTAQKRSDQIVRSERIAHLILEQAGEAIVVCDATGRIVRANEAARALHGGAVAGQPFETAFPLCREGESTTFNLAEVLRGERVQGLQLCIESAGLPPNYLLVSAGPLVDQEGTVIGCVVNLTDFTETRNITAALMRTNAELEQFAYAAAHDLQEPLRMISTYSQLLIRRYGQDGDEDAREFSSYVESGVKRMHALLGDLLSYSRITHGGDERRTVDCNAVLRGALENCAMAIEETAAVVEAADLPPVHGDSAELLEVFQNLISNALKYTKSTPHIRVSAVPGPREHTFSVEDDGIGIEEQYHDRIFGLFKRLHSRDYPGTGIGLAICKRVVEKHGGRIWVESEPEHGANFRFTLPAARE